MKFEWDEDKNESNIAKHGLDFEDAAEIFNAPMLIALDTRQNYGEDRWIAVGLIEYRDVVVVYTYRDRDTNTVRVISMRKALQYEKHQYEEFLRNRLGAD